LSKVPPVAMMRKVMMIGLETQKNEVHNDSRKRVVYLESVTYARIYIWFLCSYTDHHESRRSRNRHLPPPSRLWRHHVVNLLTGWISARFGNESRALDLNLSTDEVQHADGEAILFRRAPPDRMPHARLMAMVRELHRAGYEKLYLYSWPKPSGLHWRWHLFTGQRDWMQRPGAKAGTARAPTTTAIR
jgi:hypothetical protein